MKKKTNRPAVTISDTLMALYRRFPPIDPGDSMRGLQSYLLHGALFAAQGDTVMAVATERAWWLDALLLASAPAASQEAARLKIEALQPAVNGTIWQTASDGHRALGAMISAAIEVERRTWGLAAATRH